MRFALGIGCATVALGLLIPSVLAEEKDLMAGVFDLPAGVHLRADQKEQLQKLKQRYENPLRSLIGKYQSASEEKERIPLAREITRIKAEIKKEIERILEAPDPELIKRMKEAQRKAEEQKRKQQLAAAKKKNTKKRH